MADQSLASLNERFGLGGAVRFELGQNALPRAVVNAESEAHLYLHGAHLTHFQRPGQRPLLFVSAKSAFEKAKAIRGGVPILFPWFGPRDGVDRTQMHGFVRTMEWDVSDVRREAAAVQIVLITRSSDVTRRIWPGDFQALFTVSVGPILQMSLEITNTGNQPFTFEEGLHTYFAVSDVRQVSVQGLRGHFYRDRNISPDSQLDTADGIRFPTRVDRVYRDARGICTINDPAWSRQIIVSKENSATTVVWNPGEMAPGEFSDLAADDWQKFVCVESCNARDNAYTLAPGETHALRATIDSRSI